MCKRPKGEKPGGGKTKRGNDLAPCIHVYISKSDDSSTEIHIKLFHTKFHQNRIIKEDCKSGEKT